MEQRIISDVEAKLSTLYANMREPKEIKLLGALQFFREYLQRELEQPELDLSTLTKTQIDDLIEDCLLLGLWRTSQGIAGPGAAVKQHPGPVANP
jgi:hypothetical protein